jgi:hypothetical protein
MISDDLEAERAMYFQPPRPPIGDPPPEPQPGQPDDDDEDDEGG